MLYRWTSHSPSTWELLLAIITHSLLAKLKVVVKTRLWRILPPVDTMRMCVHSLISLHPKHFSECLLSFHLPIDAEIPKPACQESQLTTS
jgi:hypothetical protein